MKYPIIQSIYVVKTNQFGFLQRRLLYSLKNYFYHNPLYLFELNAITIKKQDVK